MVRQGCGSEWVWGEAGCVVSGCGVRQRVWCEAGGVV